MTPALRRRDALWIMGTWSSVDELEVSIFILLGKVDQGRALGDEEEAIVKGIKKLEVT